MKAIAKFKHFMQTEEPDNTRMEDNVTMTIAAVILLGSAIFIARFIQLGLVF